MKCKISDRSTFSVCPYREILLILLFIGCFGLPGKTQCQYEEQKISSTSMKLVGTSQTVTLPFGFHDSVIICNHFDIHPIFFTATQSNNTLRRNETFGLPHRKVIVNTDTGELSITSIFFNEPLFITGSVTSTIIVGVITNIGPSCDQKISNMPLCPPATMPPVSFDFRIIGSSPTPEICLGKNSSFFSIQETSTNLPVNCEIMELVNASKFTDLPSSTYTVVVTNALGDPCSATTIGTVTALRPCSAVFQMNQNGGGTPKILAPSSCGNRLNFMDDTNNVTFFHDFILVTSVLDETWKTTTNSSIFFSDEGATIIQNHTLLPEPPPGTSNYYLDLVGHASSVGSTADDLSFPFMTAGGTCLSTRKSFSGPGQLLACSWQPDFP